MLDSGHKPYHWKRNKRKMGKGNNSVANVCHTSLRILIWFSACTFRRKWRKKQEQQNNSNSNTGKEPWALKIIQWEGPSSESKVENWLRKTLDVNFWSPYLFLDTYSTRHTCWHKNKKYMSACKGFLLCHNILDQF